MNNNRRLKSRPKKLNRYGIGTIYIKQEDERLWLKAADKADSLRMSRSQYIMLLLERDLENKWFLIKDLHKLKQ